MDKYLIRKVLNNNVVIAEYLGEELILIGKGIGFNTNKNKYIPSDKVENIFSKRVSDDENYNRILENINSEIVGISEEIITSWESKLGTKLNSGIHVSLPDHINFSITRYKQDLLIENPFIDELKVIYPQEFALAVEALKMINQRFNITLPEDEAGFISLHIRAALKEQDVSQSLAYTRKLGEIMELISSLLKKKFDKNSLEYVRTVTHINFMLERAITGKTIKNPLLDNIKKELYNEYNLAIIISMKMEDLFSVKVSDDEKGYLAIHLSRLTEL